MVTDDNRETNLVAMVAVKANSVKSSYNDYDYTARERRILDHQITDETSILRFIEDNWHL